VGRSGDDARLIAVALVAVTLGGSAAIAGAVLAELLAGLPSDRRSAFWVRRQAPPLGDLTPGQIDEHTRDHRTRAEPIARTGHERRVDRPDQLPSTAKPPYSLM